MGVSCQTAAKPAKQRQFLSHSVLLSHPSLNCSPAATFANDSKAHFLLHINTLPRHDIFTATSPAKNHYINTGDGSPRTCITKGRIPTSPPRWHTSMTILVLTEEVSQLTSTSLCAVQSLIHLGHLSIYTKTETLTRPCPL